MRAKQLFADDNAVSPVIGVILMVAITVILAAVIASFVLGLGAQNTVTPSAAFSVEYSNTSSAVGGFGGNLTVVHDSGDPIRENELYLRGSGFAEVDGSSNTWENYRDNSGTGSFTGVSGGENVPTATVSGQTEGEDAVVAGDRLTTGANGDYQVSVVFESSEGDTSATFATSEGPSA